MPLKGVPYPQYPFLSHLSFSVSLFIYVFMYLSIYHVWCIYLCTYVCTFSINPSIYLLTLLGPQKLSNFVLHFLPPWRFYLPTSLTKKTRAKIKHSSFVLHRYFATKWESWIIQVSCLRLDKINRQYATGKWYQCLLLKMKQWFLIM
jgi:hypothetical protein